MSAILQTSTCFDKENNIFFYFQIEMDIDDQKVFIPSVTRRLFSLNNNLYDIIQKDVAKPIEINEDVRDTCNFTPKNGKLYLPKRKSKLKVVTVGDIRNLYEKDIYETLPYELEKQQRLLLRKIRDGFSNDKNTKNIALNLLKSDKPISKSSWQMLMNLNPECHNHSSQYVLWNGKCIQVNGSKGSKNKFICHYDISKAQKTFMKNSYTTRKILTKRRGLLRDSLNIKFKPGPLSKKGELDNSYQKYHGSKIELIDLPRPGLFFKPSYGTILEPMVVKSLIQNVREEDGTISEKWAQFAVSVIGKATKNGIDIENDNSVTFDLKYRCNQKRILMRRDIDIVRDTLENNMPSNEDYITLHEPELTSEVKNVLDKIVDSVEISLNQNLFYSGIDESRELLSVICTSNVCRPIKEKGKRKYCELDRLDVTVIRLSDKRKKNDTVPCRELFCTLGCVCDSLERGCILKDHCGQVDCMFGCKCDFTKFKTTDNDGVCSELLPGLFHLDKKLNDKLSKEEQKFHQTVIVTDEKSILLKSKRRNWKASKKYADFYSNMNLRTDIKNDRFLCIAIPKLKCDNIEPWCMVHNLYKCFCKGKFTQSFVNNFAQIEELNTDDDIHKKRDPIFVVDLTETDSKSKKINTVPNIIPINKECDLLNYDCARITPFAGRKFSDGYYLRTNERILEMEKNDMKLHTKMLNLISKSCEIKQTRDNTEQNNVINNLDGSDESPFALDNLLNNVHHEQEKLTGNMNDNVNELREKKEMEEIKLLPNKTKLVEWLEISYKRYKEKVDKGLWKPVLNTPRIGKMALYPWSFILGRYQERKNLFLISKDKPFRIFVAVNAKHKFFENCVNVRHIPLSHINEYSALVRNLINNVQDSKDNFCIMHGLSLCWELIGSVSKMEEKKFVQSSLNTHQNLSINSELSENIDCFQNDISNSECATTTVISSSNISDHYELSRWFVMAIENDITEIQFFIKGFFVKYASIIKAIQVSRKVGKTVRLSSQRCSDSSDGPQFGIYATPNMNENSVFVGPYDGHEPLGIETLKNPSEDINQKKTRGLWIAIKKTDNGKVLENPLLFMPSFKNNSDKIITLDNNLLLDMYKKEQQKILREKSVSSSESDQSPDKNKMKPIKTVKPIKIRKTDGFYHLAPQSLLKKMPIRKCTFQKNENPGIVGLSSESLPNAITTDSKLKSLLLENSDPKFKSIFNKPVAEVAPQIKISNITSLCNNNTSSVDFKRNKNSEKGMFVLKPEEINNRLISNFFRVMQRDECEKINSNTDVSNKETGLNVEEFLDSSKVCTPPINDIYIISDDEDDFSDVSTAIPWRKVWITCTNIKNLGWILGRRNVENKLSFEFPGFASTNFYKEEEAFEKINEVLSRKVYVSKKIILKWRVIENEEEVDTENKLCIDDLTSDFVLCKQGLIHKSSFTLLENSKKMNSLEEEIPAVASTSTEYGEINVVVKKEETIIEDDE